MGLCCAGCRPDVPGTRKPLQRLERTLPAPSTVGRKIGIASEAIDDRGGMDGRVEQGGKVAEHEQQPE